jgi:hypothetical protein
VTVVDYNSADDAAWKRRLVQAEINGRRVNEAIEPAPGTARSAVFVCECGYLGCNATVEMTIAEYEAVRTDFDRFLVVPGHVAEEVDTIVERHAAHLVVVKPDSEAQEMAQSADERTP